jgi:hypothetical protein
MGLHVWTADDEEWVIAESAQDACAVYCAHIGCEPSATVDSDWGTHPEHWSQMADDEVLRLQDECPEHHRPGVGCARCNSTGILRTALSCAQHVARAGRSYVGSANF